MKTTAKKSSWRLFFSGLLPLLVLAHFGHHVVAGQLTPLLPFIRSELHLDYTRSGFLVSSFTFCYGFSQLPAGWLTDRVGRRVLILVSTSGMAVAGILIGLSPNYLAMAICLMLLGTCGGGYHPSSAPLVSASVEPSKRGQALGIHQIGGNASHFLSPLIAVGLARAFGWRGSFITMGIFGMILGIALYILLGQQELTKIARPEKSATTEERLAVPNYLRRLVVFLIVAIGVQALNASVILFSTLFLVDRLKISGEAAAGLLSIVYFVALFAGPVAGYLSDRVGSLTVVLTVSFFVGLAVLTLGAVPYIWGVSALLAIIGFCNWARMPTSESYIISHVSERHRGTILGVYFGGMRALPSIITPTVGFLADHFGFTTSFTILGVAMLFLTLVCSVFLWGTRERTPVA